MFARIPGLVCGFSLVLIGMASVYSQGFPGGPPGGPGGFGGPFRMMAGLENSPLGLAAMPEVQTELKLSEAQTKTVDQLIEEQMDSVRSVMDSIDMPSMMELEPGERDAKMAELRAQIEQANEPLIRKLMDALQPSQRDRLIELQLRREGPVALRRKDVVERLALDDQQQEQLKSILNRLQPQAGMGGPPGGQGRFPGGPPGLGPPDPFANDEQRRKDSEEALKVLTPEQRDQWIAMQGKDFRFPEPRMGGPMQADVALLDKFDENQDGWLNKDERAQARVEAKRSAGGGPGGRRGMFGPPGGRGGGPPGMGGNRPAAQPGVAVQPTDVANFPDAELFEPSVFRTLFFEFENDKDWESELADFKSTDVEVPATLAVDGQTYPNVGVSFRGTSSYMMIPAGYKRSLNVSMDLVDEKQRLYGYKTLNLLNSNGDPTLMNAILYSHIARQYMPAPKANLVRVVINGEDWGVYQSVEQFNKDFVDEHYDSAKGTRWKVPGSPGGGGSLAYLGDDVTRYRRLYQIKSKDNDQSWQKLIELCRTLNETPSSKLPEAIEPMLDVDETLRFLALDVALINSDGYWTRASDYNIYLDESGKFHIIPHDMNEAFSPPMGPGGGGGRGGRPGGAGGRPGASNRPSDRSGEPRLESERGTRPAGGPPPGPGRGGVDLDPLVGLDDASKPLRSKLLAVPQFREKYLNYVEQIARHSLDWQSLGPVIAQYRKLIEDEVAIDTRKLSSTEAFMAMTSDSDSASNPGARQTLKDFLGRRREYLLKYCEDYRARER